MAGRMVGAAHFTGTRAGIQPLAWALGAVAAVALGGLQLRSAWLLLGSRQPLGAASGRPVVLLYLASIVLVAAVSAFGGPRGRRAAAAAAAALAGLALVLVAIPGRQAAALLGVAALVLAAAGAGRLAWRWTGPGPAATGRGLAEIAIGFGLLASVLAVGGRAGLLRWWTVWPVLGLLALSTVRLLVAGGIGPARRWLGQTLDDPLRAGVLAELVVTGAFALVWTAAPELQYDALMFKAWLAERYAETGRVGAELAHPWINVHGTAVLLAVPGHLVAAPATGRFLQLAAAALLVALLWATGGPAGWAGPVLAAVAGTAPVVLHQAGSAYDDLYTAFVAAGFALVLVRGLDTARPPLALLGLAGGAAVGAKPTLLPLVGVALVGAVAVGGRGGGGTVRAGRAVLAFALTGLPLAAIRFLDTGNPLFPAYNGIFRSPFFPARNAYSIFPYTPDGGVGALLRLAVQSATDPGLYMEAAPPGFFGLALLPLALALLVLWRGRRGERVAWASLLAFCAVWWLQFRYLRFLVPAAAFAAVALGSLLGRRPGPPGWPRAAWSRALVLGVAVLAGATFTSRTAAAFQVPGRFPLAVAIGLETPSAYLRRALDGEYEALEYVNRHAGAGERVITESPARLYLRRDLRLHPHWEFSILAGVDVGAGGQWRDPAQLAGALRSAGARWLLLTWEAGVPCWFSCLLPRLLQAEADLVLVSSGARLYRLREE